MSEANSRGRFVWHELMTTDVTAGLKFYKKVVGWKSEAMKGGMPYELLLARVGPVAGAMALPEEAKRMGAPPSWMTYIGTPDVDDTAREAESLGARILRAPSDIPGIGRFAILQDPQGAAFAIYRAAPGSPEMPDTAAGPGEFSWHELATTDVEAAFDFYRRLFGWHKTTAMDMGPELGTYQMFGWGGQPQGGIYVKPASMSAPSHWLPYAKVPDSKRAAATIRSAGGTILNGPMEVPGGDWIVMALDPQGAAFAVHSSAPPKPGPAKPDQAKSAPKPKKAAAKKAAKKKAAVKKPAKKAVKKKAVKKKTAKKAAKKPARRRAARKAVGSRSKARRGTRKSPKRAARKPASRRPTRSRGR